MEYVELGKTGLKISRLGFGGIPIQKIDAEGTRKLVLRMAEAGINYIDTARGYTVSEAFLGEALQGRQGQICACHQEHGQDEGGHGRRHRDKP